MFIKSKDYNAIILTVINSQVIFSKINNFRMYCYWITSIFTSFFSLIVPPIVIEILQYLYALIGWKIGLTPSSIYSCSIGHILEHEFCHLGCQAVTEKFLKQQNFCLSKQLLRWFFQHFEGKKKNLKIC